MVYTHTVPQGQTVSATYYISVLKQLMKDNIPEKCQDLVRRWKLHQDNARVHVANASLTSLTKKNIETVLPPYSPDLAPNYFFLYLQSKKHLKGKCFQSAKADVMALGAILKKIFADGFKQVFLE